MNMFNTTISIKIFFINLLFYNINTIFLLKEFFTLRSSGGGVSTSLPLLLILIFLSGLPLGAMFLLNTNFWVLINPSNTYVLALASLAVNTALIYFYVNFFINIDFNTSVRPLPHSSLRTNLYGSNIGTFSILLINLTVLFNYNYFIYI